MPRLIWSPAALDDVQRLHRFLAVKNTDAVRRAVKVLRESIKIIAQHPEIGCPVEHMEIEFPEWLIEFGASGYVVLYRYDGEVAVILAVRQQFEVEY